MRDSSSPTRVLAFLGMLFLPVFVGLVVFVVCSDRVVSEEGSGAASTGLGTAVTASFSTASTVQPRDCTPSVPPDFGLTQTDPVAAAVELSSATYPCAAQVGLVPAADRRAAATLAAAGLDGPLLVVGERFTSLAMAELSRLAPDTVLVAGLGGDLERTLFEYYVRFLEVDPQAVLIRSHAESGEVWLVGGDAPVGPLAVTAAHVGAALVVADPDFRALPAGTRELISQSEELRVMSEFDPETAWQLDTVRRNEEIPGGGLLMFDDASPRRLVALYGHPVASALGVLGEQGPEEGVERLAEIAAGYKADGALVLPTFEIIATVASAEAGGDGDYSAAVSRDVIHRWVETAAANDVYVVLDLQPGRTDFLTQAKYYEEFLRMPHVGLALDPEWRLEPNQVHLRQIGTVDAEEVNRVVAWLAGIVREEGLPQKLLIVHQFRFSMITNRELIETPPELAIVIQMDGQGSLEVKYNTWNVLTRGTEESNFRWGWKNFYDEDSPTATPTQVLELTPVPVFVSYQ